MPWRGWVGGPTGTVTDDTQLTMVMAQWLLDEADVTDLAGRILDWGSYGRGIGQATRQALSRLDSGTSWWHSGSPSAGNGAAMRAAPFGLRYAGDLDAMRAGVALGSAPTHADSTAIAAAVVQAVAVSECLRAPGELDWDDFLGTAVEVIADLDLPALAHRGTGERRTLAQRIEEVRGFRGHRPGEVFDHFYNGAFVLETTPVVLWCLLSRQDDPEDAMVTAVMGGRDADTVAAMVGNLVGALHGLEALPARWRGDQLEHHDRLIVLADGLYTRRWGPLRGSF